MRKVALLIILGLIPAITIAQGSVNKRLNVVILGDSNTSIGGDDCNIPKGWTKWFCERFNPASCRSYARSGATWSHTVSTIYDVEENTGKLSDHNVIYNQINRLKQAVKQGRQVIPDVILIAAGTNDAWFQQRRPKAFTKTVEQVFDNQDAFITERTPQTVLSLAEVIRYDCELLMEAFPEAQIVLLTPIQSVATNDIGKVSDIIAECGHMMSLSVIRQNFGSSIYRVREKVQHKYTSDGTHTTELGARRNGYFIANQLNAILLY